MSALFDSNSPYGAASGSSYDAYGPSSSSAGNKNAPPNLQFYSAGNSMSPGLHSAGAYGGSGDPYRSGSSSNGRPSLEGNMTGGSFGGPRGTMMSGQMSWWSAFGTGGFPDEPGLMEELGVNLQHIKEKSLTVLNPFHSYSATHARDAHMMDDADLTGPLMFCFAFGMLLLLSGKSSFGYIYGVGLLGDIAIYLLLNMMSESGIDAYRVSSVLGYSLLPLCVLAAISVVVRLDGLFGYIVAPVFIIWCSSSASGIFVSILRMTDQRLLVAYPVGLFYACFALLSVFDMDISGNGRKR